MIGAPCCSSFVQDGWSRWYDGAEAAIRAEFTAELAERLQGVTWLRRLLLRLEVEREIERRMRDVKRPSEEALF